METPAGGNKYICVGSTRSEEEGLSISGELRNLKIPDMLAAILRTLFQTIRPLPVR